jgi:hypothetical protein
MMRVLRTDLTLSPPQPNARLAGERKRMALRPPSARRRPLALGATVLALGALTLPVLSGCSTLPYVLHAAVSICKPLLTAILDDPVDTLPPQYRFCGSHEWRVRGAQVRFCLYCSPDAADPVYIQLDCEGKFHPLKPRTADDGHPAEPTLDAGGLIIDKLSCEEHLLAIAQASADEFRSRADATIVLPNDRVLPDVTPYDGIRVHIDGASALPDGKTEVGAGAAVRVFGDFDQVARYAAELGVRSLEFRDGNDAWSVEVNHQYAAIAIFRNAQLVETRFLFAPADR